MRFPPCLETDCSSIDLIVKDLATRFADGRLSSSKIMQADDEQLAEMLIAVKGIGRVS